MIKRLIRAALSMQFVALGASIYAERAPAWLLLGIVALSCAGVLLALLSAALRH